MTDSASSPAGHPIATLRQLASDLLGRAGLAARAGITFAGKRDLFTALGYKRVLDPQDYRDRFKRGDLASRIVEALPKATWRGGGELVEDEDPTVETDFEQAWDALNTRLSVWSLFSRADVLAGLGRYAVILIGAPGELEQELGRVTGPDQVAYLQVYGEDDAKIETLVTDPHDARFGLPLIYRLKRADASNVKRDRPVHYSRIIHIADGVLDDEVYGQPRLERVWNRLDDLEKVVGGGSEAFWLRAHQGYQFNLDKDIKLEPAEETKLKDEVDEFINGMRRAARTRGVTMKTLGSDVANFNGPVMAIVGLISAATGIPQRILLGSERGELSSTQDRDNWNERVTDRRTEFAGPHVVRPLIDRLIACGALPMPAQYEVRWPQIQNLDEAGRVAVAKDAAEVNQAAGETVITSDEIRDRYLGLPPLEEVVGDGGLTAAESHAHITTAATHPWEAVLQAASQKETRAQKILTAAFDAARSAVDLEALTAACDEEDDDGATRLLLTACDAADTKLQEAWPPFLLDVLVAGGQASASVAKKAGSFSAAARGLRLLAGPLDIAFDRTNPEAARWVREASARLVTEVSAATRAAIRTVLARAFEEGLPPRQAARLLRALVGLTERAAEAVLNLRGTLAEAEPGSLVMAGRVRIRVPKTGATADLINRAASRYATRLHNQRTRLIARTETMAASNQGQQQLWRQAVTKGLLTGDERRTWIVTPDDRLCDLCKPMDGQERGLNEKFVAPDGTAVETPPLHPACRCAVSLAMKRARGAA